MLPSHQPAATPPSPLVSLATSCTFLPVEQGSPGRYRREKPRHLEDHGRKASLRRTRRSPSCFSSARFPGIASRALRAGGCLAARPRRRSSGAWPRGFPAGRPVPRAVCQGPPDRPDQRRAPRRLGAHVRVLARPGAATAAVRHHSPRQPRLRGRCAAHARRARRRDPGRHAEVGIRPVLLGEPAGGSRTAIAASIP